MTIVIPEWVIIAAIAMYAVNMALNLFTLYVKEMRR